MVKSSLVQIGDQYLPVIAQLLSQTGRLGRAGSGGVECEQQVAAVTNGEMTLVGLVYGVCQPSRTRLIIFRSSVN